MYKIANDEQAEKVASHAADKRAQPTPRACGANYTLNLVTQIKSNRHTPNQRWGRARFDAEPYFAHLCIV